MSKKYIILLVGGLLVGVPLLVMGSRLLLIDWFVVATDRFAPEIQNEEWLFVCRVCNDFEAGDYVIYFDEERRSYMVERVLRGGVESVETTGIDELSQEIRLQHIHGKVIGK